jgi:ABC-type phosphate/phosphonate transport system substrate-binding protein
MRGCPWKKTVPRSSEERTRPSRRRGAPVCLGALLLLLVSASIGFAAPPDNGSTPTMIMGMSANVLSGVDLRDAQASMRMWLGQSRPEDGKAFVSDVRILADDAEMRKAVEKNEVNYVIALAIDYIRLRDLGLVGKDNAAGVSGDTSDEYVLVVSRDGNIKKLEDLKQRRMLVQVGGLGEVPTIWLDTVLMKQGLPTSRRFCREVKDAAKASGAVLPVFFGQADACVVVKKAFMTMIELNPQVGKRLSVIAQSGVFMRAVSWFGKDWDRKSVDTYRAKMLESQEGASGRQFLTLMGYRTTTIWDPTRLAPLEALLKEYDELSRKARETAAQNDIVKPKDSSALPPAAAPETSGRTDAQVAKEK